MINTNNTLSTGAQRFDFVGWKAYKEIKKKAMEQKFSWSGLLISMSIAFFIVILSACLLNTVYLSLEQTKKHEIFLNQKIYQLEEDKSLNNGLAINFRNIISASAVHASEGEYRGEPNEWTHYADIEAGGEIKYKLTFKNTGDKIWKKGEVSLETGPFLRSFSKLKHDTWLKYYQIIKINQDVNPGQAMEIIFNFQSPDDINGTIQENFYLVAENKIIPGTEVRFFITLESIDMVYDKPENNIISSNNLTENLKTEDKLNNNKEVVDFCAALSEKEKEEFVECQTNIDEKEINNGISENIKYESEPILRIGLFNTNKAQRITSNSKYNVYSGDKLILQNLPAGYVSTISYDLKKSLYVISTPGITKFLDKPIRLAPISEDGIATLLDYENRAVWNNSINYNQYRNIVEFNFSLNTGKFWVINELPISYYLKGLAETSNYSPVDYQKVIATAARTYALYHYNRGIEYDVPDGSTKHAAEHFHLDATYDQVYKGYVSENLLNRLSEAVNATKGIAIIYDGKVVVTPYFSRSDGRTRSWEEVWYGDPKPWLKSVSVPEDRGEVLWGHGVGLSAQAALEMVRDKSVSWENALKHFYSGIDLQKVY